MLSEYVTEILDFSKASYTEEECNRALLYQTELMQSYYNDRYDSFYCYDPLTDSDQEKAVKAERLSSLDDVVFISRNKVLVVRHYTGAFVGKIDLYYNDVSKVLNCMFLYVSGNRRRILGKQSKRTHLHGAHLIWYFVAIEALKAYGVDAHVLITCPRRTIAKYIDAVGGMYVPLVMNECCIKSSVDYSLFTLQYHNDARRELLLNQYIKSGVYFRAMSMISIVELLERSFA